MGEPEPEPGLELGLGATGVVPAGAVPEDAASVAVTSAFGGTTTEEVRWVVGGGPTTLELRRCGLRVVKKGCRSAARAERRSFGFLLSNELRRFLASRNG